MKIVFVLALLIFFTGCNKQPEAIYHEMHKEVFSFFPSDIQFLLFADFQKGKEMSIPGENWLSDVEKKTGFGFQNGFSRFYTATTWDMKIYSAFILNKDPAPLHRYFEENYSKKTIAGKNYYYGDDKLFFHFPAADILITINDEAALQNLIEKKAGTLSDDEEFIQLINEISYQESYWMATNQQVFAMTLINQLFGLRDQNFPGQHLLNSVSGFTLAFEEENEDNVLMESIWKIRNTGDAYLLFSAVRAAKESGLLSGRNQSFSSIIEKTEINRDGEKIIFTSSLTKEELEQLNLINKNMIEDENKK
jgi:hypothetical protein